MIKFIQNIGEYFSSNYFDEDFNAKVLSKTGYAADDIKDFNKRVSPLKDKFFRFKQLFIEDKLRIKDKIYESHQFHTALLNVLGYDGNHPQYNNLFHISENEVIPVRHILYRGDQVHLMIMEMQALINEDNTDSDGLFEQRYNVEDETENNPPQKYHRTQWDRVFQVPAHLKISPVIINKAISELFLIEPHLRPKYILLLAGNMVYLLEQEKWFRGSYLVFDLEELFTEATANRNANYYALFYFLLSKESLTPESNMVLLDQLDEDSHKSAYEVTKDLKEGIIHAVEALANEALYFQKNVLQEVFDETDDTFEQEIKDDCLNIIYRLLFVFYAESREDLDILPSNDSIYNKGYSLEMLRDLEQVPLYSEASLNGYFFHESLDKLFYLLSSGYREKENAENKSFRVRRIDSPLFNNAKLHHLHKVKFRNKVLQDIICRLSLSKQQRNRTRGRISYANLGINQLGSVYESLLAYRGFYAEQDYIEVHKADTPNEGTYLVPRMRRDDFQENEILKDSAGHDIIIKKGTFVYRLSGRDRQKSASYYTPEVLTRCTVKYTLKPILEKLDKGEMKATELLELKLLEPAMGAAAFHNEMINQLAETYLTYRQKELNKRVAPDLFKEELQKVKAYIATNNTYGVDLNPTAIELGKLSLWLNVIHKDMETPFFSNRLAVGNAVVGAWLKVYKEKDIAEDLDARGITLARQTKKEWWDIAPRQLEFKPNKEYDKIKHGRKSDEIYHFLLPDKNMVPSAGIKILKAEYDTESKAVTKWKKDFCEPIKKSELEQLRKICNKVDELLSEFYRFQRSINLQTANRHNIFGALKNSEQAAIDLRSYDEKERLADQRNRRNAPYFKLKMVMDYWCSLWFWDVRDAKDLPNRQQYWQDIAAILELDLSAVDVNEAAKKKASSISAGIQPKLFFTGDEQLTLGEETDNATVFAEAVVEYANRKDLFDNNQRLAMLSQLANKYFFFHPQLEFLDVFWERGGFDLIAGNPPWVSVGFNDADFIIEYKPELVFRGAYTAEIQEMNYKILESNSSVLKDYLNENNEQFGVKNFMGAISNYPVLSGSRNNLYKCVLSNSLNQINKNGIAGILHPDVVFEDSDTSAFRKVLYEKMEFHFRFRNELKLFSEVGNYQSFSINIYSGKCRNSFTAIFNLFHPSTIDSSFTNSGYGEPGGLKTYTENGFNWNILGHANRIIRIDENELELFRNISNIESSISPPLPTIHSINILETFKKLFNFPKLDIPWFFTDGFNETIAQKQLKIKRDTGFVNINLEDLIVSGPNFFVANPYFQTPKEICNSHRAYEVIDPYFTNEQWIPRSNYKQNQAYADMEIEILGEKSSWRKSNKLMFSKMLNLTNTRTLQSAIYPGNCTHINSVVSLTFSKEIELIKVASMTSSIIYDFIIRNKGLSNLYENVLRSLPFNWQLKYQSEIISRILRLNCVSNIYAKMWSDNFFEKIKLSEWSKSEKPLTQWSLMTKEYSSKVKPQNFYEVRQLLVELDVLIAMNFNLTLKDLIQIYQVQFSVEQQNEFDTFYDIFGNIVFTSNKSYSSIGVDRPVWETIRHLKAGETYEHTITKSELYFGKKVTYHAPFNKCDRVEDYKVAWEHFEKIFKDKKD